MAYKLYQIKKESGKTVYMILDEAEDYPENYLEYDETIETDCWLGDTLGCDKEDIFIATCGLCRP